MFGSILKFHWSLFRRVQLTIFQHWFRLWLGAIQATSHFLKQWWLIYGRIYESLCLNELNLTASENSPLDKNHVLQCVGLVWNSTQNILPIHCIFTLKMLWDISRFLQPFWRLLWHSLHMFYVAQFPWRSWGMLGRHPKWVVKQRDQLSRMQDLYLAKEFVFAFWIATNIHNWTYHELNDCKIYVTFQIQLKILAMKCFDQEILCYLLYKLVILCIINLNICLQYKSMA